MSTEPQFDRLPATFQPTTLIIPLALAADGLSYGPSQLAYFGDGTIPRTRQHFEVLDGRKPHQQVSSYPSSLTEHVPFGTALRDICRSYPNHVSGSMLLVFDAAGWTAWEIWVALPVAFKLADPMIRRYGKGPNKKVDRFPFRWLDDMMKAQKMAALVAVGAEEEGGEDQLSMVASAGASSDGAGEWPSDESATLC